MTLFDIKKNLRALFSNKKFDTEILAKTLLIAKKVYYNSGDNLPPKVIDWFETNITDDVFDFLEEKLREAEPNSSYFDNNIGAPVSNASARKTKLPVPMPSLDKIKPDSKHLLSFIKKGPFVISAKLDGVSLLICTKGKLYTRGNGTVGQDISHLWDILGLPRNIKGDYTIRAEMIISKENFEANKSLFSPKGGEAKNARNTMSGLVNSGKVSRLFKYVDVLGYSVLGKKPSEAFPLMEKLGFKTAYWKVMKSLNLDLLNKYLVKVKEGDYDADGLVVSKDVIELPKETNPVNTLAFKNNATNDTKEFKVKKVVWEPSKHGLLKPVLSLVPQSLDGVTISKCTAFNGKFVKENNLGPGARVKLVRSGGVIPHVLEVTKQASEPQMPEEYVWSGADIKLPDVESNDMVSIKKISHFFKYLGAEGISRKFFEKMYANGYDDLKSILTVSKKRLLDMPGVQEKSASSIYREIQKTKEATLADYMVASGCFPSIIAESRITSVLNKYPNILEYSSKEMTIHVSSIPGFSAKTTRAFVVGAEKFKKWFSSLKRILTIKEPEKTKLKSTKLKYIVVVPTGFRFDADTKKKIEENGGKVQVSITKDTTHVVTKDKSKSSTKIEKAKKNGIEVISLEELLKLIPR